MAIPQRAVSHCAAIRVHAPSVLERSDTRLSVGGARSAAYFRLPYVCARSLCYLLFASITFSVCEGDCRLFQRDLRNDVEEGELTEAHPMSVCAVCYEDAPAPTSPRTSPTASPATPPAPPVPQTALAPSAAASTSAASASASSSASANLSGHKRKRSLTATAQ
jgi:hypothetical protein